MDLEDERDVVPFAVDGLAVVGETGSIGGPDVDEPRARLFHDFRNAKAATDLDAFTTTHGDVAVASQCGENQENGRRIVVDHHGGLGVDRTGEQSADPGLTTAALPGVEVEFEILRPSRLMELDRRATEVGVGDHTGGVDDRSQERCPEFAGHLVGPTVVTTGDGATCDVDEQGMGKSGRRE